MTDNLTQETEALLAAATERPRFSSRKAVPLLRRWLQHDGAQRERLEAAEAVCEAARAVPDHRPQPECCTCGLCEMESALAKWKDLLDA